MAAFLARYDGHCAAACGDPVEAGDLVEYEDDELMHAECAQGKRREQAFLDLEADFGVDPVPRPVPTCDECWMEQPCFCGGDDR